MSTTAPREMTAHNTLHALLFQSTSAEYTALCIQAYQLARHALRQRLESRTFRNPAVIFDLDETVFDNSAYQAWQLRNGTNYHDDSWNAWCNAAESEAVPGALEFVRFVKEEGATPFFITSRNNITRAATLANLNALGALSDEDLENEKAWMKDSNPSILPENTRLFMKRMLIDAQGKPIPLLTNGPSGDRPWSMDNKFDHRMWVSGWRGYEIILSVGDNLADYAEYYGQVAGKTASIDQRHASVLQDAALFGRDFVLIPNATYGGWLRAFEGNQLGSSDELALTSFPVRQGLQEATKEFIYANPSAGQGEPTETSITSKGPKFDKANGLRIWKE